MPRQSSFASLVSCEASDGILHAGLARLVTTRSLDYQLAVGEYGQHWNFFLTLAAVKALTAAAAMPRDLWLPAGERPLWCTWDEVCIAQFVHDHSRL